MNPDFIQALHDLEEEKGIKQQVLLDAIEAALISSYKKNYNSVQNVRVKIDEVSGNINVYAQKTVVEEPLDARLEISLDAAREMNALYQVGDTVDIEVTPRDFGRIAAQAAKQVVTQRIREAERGMIYDEYKDQVDELAHGIVQRKDTRQLYVDLGRTEAVLPLNDLMPTDRYRHGDRIKAYITKVDNTPKGPQIYLSRTNSGLLKRLFEKEVPEIENGVVTIESIAREAGMRSKIAVASRDPEVDPIGACVGPHGERVQHVVDELGSEKIDIVRHSSVTEEFIANSLSPSKVLEVILLPEEKTARVIVPDYQLSLAIGMKGQNARLAAKLTGYKIDIKSETQAEQEFGRPIASTDEMPQDFATID